MRWLALLALLLASSSLVAAPAPVPKPQRKPARPASTSQAARQLLDSIDEPVLRVWRVNAQQQALQWAPLLLPPTPTQPPTAAPPGYPRSSLDSDEPPGTPRRPRRGRLRGPRAAPHPPAIRPTPSTAQET